MAGLAIRRYRPGDERALWVVFHAAVHQTAAADYTAEQLDAWAPRNFDMAAWDARIDRIRPWVAEFDGTPVGYADVQSDGYIDHFFVAPWVARRGVGARLMERIHRSAWDAGTRRLWADVSLGARGFFERFGFGVEATRDVRVRGVVLRNSRMSKGLESRTDVDACSRAPDE
jgi:putative acetyltransferase